MSSRSGLPLVSIVVPCRNEAGFIGTCPDSILASEYPPDRLEVLVVDGLSEDGTRPIVERYAARDGRIRLFGGIVNFLLLRRNPIGAVQALPQNR